MAATSRQARPLGPHPARLALIARPGLILAFLLGVLSPLAGCTTVAPEPAPLLAATPMRDGTTILAHATTTFANDLKLSSVAPDDPGLASNALKTGRSLLDLHCNQYLDQLGMTQQSHANQRRQTDLVGGFTSAILGLAGSPSSHVAAVAAGSTFVGSSLDSFSAAYLFSDATRSLVQLVREARRAFIDGLTVPRKDLDYATMVDILSGYEAVCRPAQIKALINEALTNARVEAEPVANAKGQGGAARSPKPPPPAAGKPGAGPVPSLPTATGVLTSRVPTLRVLPAKGNDR